MSKALPLLFALILTTLMAGCGEVIVFGHVVREGKPSSEVKADASAATAADADVKRHAVVVRSVALALTPDAATGTSDDKRFNGDALLAAIRSELQSRKLLDDTKVDAGAAVVSIDEYSMRRTSNVILFGNVNSVGMLKGSIRLEDGQGNAAAALPVEAETHISIPAEGETPNPLEPLYRDFAVATADALAGTAPAN